MVYLNGKEKLVLVRDEHLCSDFDAIPLSDLKKQIIFGYKRCSEEFKDLCEKKPDSDTYVDCEQAFVSGEHYHLLKLEKLKNELKYAFFKDYGLLFLNQNKHDNICSELRKLVEKSHNDFNDARYFINTLSFKLGEEKMKLKTEEKIISGVAVALSLSSVIYLYF